MTQGPPWLARAAPGLKEGDDDITCAIENGRAVILRAASKPLHDDPFAAFAEWDSADDRSAYAKL